MSETKEQWVAFQEFAYAGHLIKSSQLTIEEINYQIQLLQLQKQELAAQIEDVRQYQKELVSDILVKK